MTKHICEYSGIEFSTKDIGAELKALETKLAKCVEFFEDMVRAMDNGLDIQVGSAFHHCARELLGELKSE